MDESCLGHRSTAGQARLPKLPEVCKHRLRLPLLLFRTRANADQVARGATLPWCSRGTAAMGGEKVRLYVTGQFLGYKRCA